MTVTIVTVAVRENYRAFLPEWAGAVAGLERQPDEVIIVTDHVRETSHLASALPGPVTVMAAAGLYETHPQIYANQAIAASDAEWICKLDVDDLIYPHALNPLPDLDADVLMFGLSVNGHLDIPARPVTARQVADSPHNLLFAASPFRRWIWEKSSGFQDMLYDDWRFWREAAHHEARFQSSGTIDYHYRLHDRNATRNADHSLERQKVFSHVY